MQERMRSPIARVIPALIALVLGGTPASAITWGQPDTAHRNVGAMVVSYGGSALLRRCSGTLVHPQIFLTAGHCTVDLFRYGVREVWVNFDQYAYNRATLRPVREVITHSDYDWGPTSNPHDAGILVLADAVTDIAPANLPSEGFLDDLRAADQLRQGSTGAKFTLVGYGNRIEFPPPELRFFARREFSVSEFQALLKSWLRMSQNQATDDGGTCNGDSGGPAFWTEPDGSEILVGVTSWGDILCLASGFNYRVDTADTLDFIADVIEWLEPVPEAAPAEEPFEVPYSRTLRRDPP